MARASSKRAPASVAPRASDDTSFGAALLIILAIPRLMRIFYPQVWVEDDFYLESAWLVSAGMRPYLDFVHPHFPLLEFITAGYLKIFGAGHFTIEVLNETAIYLTSLLSFKLARRVSTRRAAISAAILYASSSLVFRYHVYERECFVAPLLLIATLLALEETVSYRRLSWIALALSTACLIKLTAFVAVAPIVAFVALIQKRRRDAILLVIAIVSAIVIAALICYAAYGREFVFQTLIFHFMKGRNFPGLMGPLGVLDIQLPLFVIGCYAARREMRTDSALMLVLAMVAPQYVFYSILSPTFWAHNFLEGLPFVTVIGGIGVDWMLDRIVETSWMALAGGLTLIVISLIWIAPLTNESWAVHSIYGFGYLDRAEVSHISKALHDASGPDEDVIAPAFICFQANRREFIRFPETYGVLREAEIEYERDGFARAREHLGDEDFFRLIANTAHFWRDPILDAIRDKKVNAIILDSSIQMLPLVLPPLMLPQDVAQMMIENGFRPVEQTEHYVLWKRSS